MAKLLLPLIFCGLAIYQYYISDKPSAQERKMQYKPVVAYSLLLGLGLGGFTDGILLHQLLQWHQMISRLLPPDTLEAKNINMFWDGVFHVVTWILTFTGVILLWKSSQRTDLLHSNKLFAGGLLAGWGLFNVLDSIFNHYLFKLHNVRENVSNPEAWNLGFLGFALLLLAVGMLLMRAGIRTKLSAPE